jgi:4-hydroxy-2-oxoheptanedioate aldolase
MARKPRLNRIIDLIERGKPAIGTFVINGSIDQAAQAADAGYDYVFIENEHTSMDFSQLRLALQFLLSRQRLSSQGNLQAHPTPILRISPNIGEIANNEWVIKQTLDYGLYGLLLPRMESVEAVQAAVAAARYAQKSRAKDRLPEGHRGWGPGAAARYWGLSVPEYYEAADLWPLDPDGEVLLMPICESVEGVKNLDSILGEAKGIGAVLAGPGDLSISMGVGPNTNDPRVEEAVLKIVKTCNKHGVACAINAQSPKDLDKRLEQGFKIFTTMVSGSNEVLERGKTYQGKG